MAAWEGEVFERLAFILLKAIGAAVVGIAARRAEDLVTALVCRASGGCVDKARAIGERAATRLTAKERLRLRRAFKGQPVGAPEPGRQGAETGGAAVDLRRALERPGA